MFAQNQSFAAGSAVDHTILSCACSFHCLPSGCLRVFFLIKFTHVVKKIQILFTLVDVQKSALISGQFSCCSTISCTVHFPFITVRNDCSISASWEQEFSSQWWLWEYGCVCLHSCIPHAWQLQGCLRTTNLLYTCCHSLMQPRGVGDIAEIYLALGNCCSVLPAYVSMDQLGW